MCDTDIIHLSSAAAAVATRLTSFPSVPQRVRAGSSPRALPLSQEILATDPECPLQTYALSVTVVQHEQNRILSQGNLQMRHGWTFHYNGDDPSKSHAGPPGYKFPVVFNDKGVPHIAVVCSKGVTTVFNPDISEHRQLTQTLLMIDGGAEAHIFGEEDSHLLHDVTGRSNGSIVGVGQPTSGKY